MYMYIVCVCLYKKEDNNEFIYYFHNHNYDIKMEVTRHENAPVPCLRVQCGKQPADAPWRQRERRAPQRLIGTLLPLSLTPMKVGHRLR